MQTGVISFATLQTMKSSQLPTGIAEPVLGPMSFDEFVDNELREQKFMEFAACGLEMN